jgi:hypothetical protein
MVTKRHGLFIRGWMIIMIIIILAIIIPPLRPEFDPRSRHVGSVVDRVAPGQLFSEYFDFPCQFIFYQLLHAHHQSGAGKIGQILADIPSGLSHQPHETKRIKFFIISPQYDPYYSLIV